MQTLTAEIFDVYRGTTHDGPGLRDTVFFKGCPLRCKWCHNPEGIRPDQEIWWDAKPCIGCASCVLACPKQALSLTEHGIVLDRSLCDACGACTAICPSKALRSVSRCVSLDELFNELMKDRAFFDAFQGGVTASGGECMMQSEFVKALFARLKEEGITTALDTSGQTSYAGLEKVLPFTDFVLYDIKEMDPALHREHTGVNNRLILDNFLQLMEDLAASRYASTVWVRTPLIPGATATGENIADTAEFLLPFLGKQVERWDLCAFNNTCAMKYRKMGIRWAFEGTELLTAAAAEQLKSIAVSKGCPEDLIRITGILR